MLCIQIYEKCNNEALNDMYEENIWLIMPIYRDVRIEVSI